MGIISWLILGLIAGFIGSKIVNKSGLGLWLDIALGIVGAIVGGISVQRRSRRGRHNGLKHLEPDRGNRWLCCGAVGLSYVRGGATSAAPVVVGVRNR